MSISTSIFDSVINDLKQAIPQIDNETYNCRYLKKRKISTTDWITDDEFIIYESDKEYYDTFGEYLTNDFIEWQLNHYIKYKRRILVLNKNMVF
jgi:hypothetical protein